MRTEVLQYIIEVDRLHSISKAANELFISPSALSESISQLEKELNVAFFIRTKNGTVTTEIGQQIIQQANSILAEVNKLYDISFHASCPIKDYTETITLGLTEKFGNSVLNEAISLSVKKHPSLTFNVISLNMEQCIDAVSNGEIQFAIIGMNTLEKDAVLSSLKKKKLRYIALSTDPIIAILNKDAPLAQKEFITYSDYSNQTLITYSSVFNYDTCPDGLTKVIGVPNFENIIQLIQSNTGMTILPYSLLYDHLSAIKNELKLIPVIDSLFFNYIIYPNQLAMSEAQKFFIHLYFHIYHQKYTQDNILSTEPFE